MNSEINSVNTSVAGGTGIAASNVANAARASNAALDGKPQVSSQGKALAEELLPKQSGPNEGSAGLDAGLDAESNRKATQRVAAQLNDYVQSIRRNLEFRVDEGTNRTVVSVIDRDSQEVIRQIPSEVVLKLAQQLSVMEEGTGFLLEDKA